MCCCFRYNIEFMWQRKFLLLFTFYRHNGNESSLLELNKNVYPINIHLLLFFFLLLYMQKDHSNLMPCWFQRVVYSIIFTMHHDAGRLLDGIKLVPPHVKTVECKCVALPCSYPVEFHCSLVLNSFAVQNISKVSHPLTHRFFSSLSVGWQLFVF